MVISKLNTTLIIDRLRVIQNSLLELGKISRFSKDDFLSDKRNPAASESFLRHAIESIFDIGRHILAKLKSKKILEYKEIAELLGAEKIIPKELSQKLIPIAGYRNRIVHFYHEITDEELYEILQKDLGDISEFVKSMEEFITFYEKRSKE
jgi:uncharacterized protein YutE (UPF0331/DUF86 family)